MKSRKRRIKFTNKSHATKGIISTILGGISLLLMIVLVVVSYSMKGAAGIYAGSIGLLSLFVAIIGLISGFTSFKERERYYLYSKVGSLTNLIIIALWIGIYIIGTWY